MTLGDAEPDTDKAEANNKEEAEDTDMAEPTGASFCLTSQSAELASVCRCKLHIAKVRHTLTMEDCLLHSRRDSSPLN